MSRGIFRTDLDNKKLLEYLETHGIKEASEHFQMPLTTVYSRLEQLDYFPMDKNNPLEFSDETVKYIETHTLIESAKHFHKGLPAIRSFIASHKLEYKRMRNEPPFYESERHQEKIKQQQLFIELHKTMKYEEIAKKFGISKAQVCQVIKYAN